MHFDSFLFDMYMYLIAAKSIKATIKITIPSATILLIKCSITYSLFVNAILFQPDMQRMNLDWLEMSL